MHKKILHIASCDKFIPPFIGFIKENFDSSDHEFMLTNGMAEENLNITSNVYLSSPSKLGRLKHYLQVCIKMQQADKIIFHSLFDSRIVQMLFVMPWLLKKSYWVMWGGDLYVYQLGQRNFRWEIQEFFRRPVIKNMGNLVTYIEGDVDLAREWYDAKGDYHECLMYLSNTYKALDVQTSQGDTINIQIGNSANSSNNHIEIFDKLLPFKDKDIRIYAPLSYGDKTHAKKVISKGKELFGEKFIALTDFMPFEQYLKFLGSIDIAIFNHKRQQAMGNTITLLGLGKKVYIRSDTTQWRFFKEKNISINDIDNLDSLSDERNQHSIDIIKEYFSEDNYKHQLGRLF